VRERARGDQARLPLARTRLATFLALAAFGSHAWVQMVQPAAPGAMLAALTAAAAGATLLVTIGRRGVRAPARIAASALVAAAMLLAALAAAGVPGNLAGPRGWDDVAAGIAQGLSAVPNVRVPYGGPDEWTRTVIVLGCGALVALAALLAFAPRRERVLGYPFAAAIVLSTLYLVPTMQREGEHPYISGAAYALLLALFLWLERVDRRSAPLAAGVVAVAVLAALVLAPRLDGSQPILDYEQIALSLSDAPSTRYDWNHSYGPLNWPREASVVLRVKARNRAYWKAANLPFFDGTRWVQSREPQPGGLNGWFDPSHSDWMQTLRVTVRGLRSSLFIGAGTTFEIRDSPRTPVATGFGVFATQGRPLRRGNAYRAVVYTPRPTARELRASAAFPTPPGTGQTTILLPGPPSPTGQPTRGQPVAIAPWGQGLTAPADIAAIEDSPYARAYALARRLRARSATPYDFVLAVEHYLSKGFEYSENPPPSRTPLEDFLFRDKVGYCQHFSGAMALLLRLGGVPARVAAGFAPGVYDRERQEFVVRDLDAHSWVEVLFGGIGWVTRDPTPSDSPARSQLADVRHGGAGAEVAIPQNGGRATERPLPGGGGGASARSANEQRSPLPLIAIGLAGVLALLGVVVALRRRLRRPAGPDDLGAVALAELLRALQRSGRPPPPQTTLDALAYRFRGSAAEGYVRALSSARYGYGAARPTAQQRAALRHELAAGLGTRGWLRAWWALPPRLAAPPPRRARA
jgi:transglutaminase-like putative cysteine protease